MPSEAISLEASRKALSASTGLYFFDRLWNRLALDQRLKPLLPQSLLATKTDSVAKAKALTLGMIEGAECLDDMEKCAADPLFRDLNGGKVNAPNTYGLFLASMRYQHCRSMNKTLKELAFRLRKALFPEEQLFILDIDSTDSKQSGQKMEGLAFNYKNNWGLDSIVAFDQFGLEYWHDVRPGNTYTANGATDIMAEVFGSCPRHTRKLFRADGGYCNVDVFNACYRQNADLLIAMRSNMADPLIKHVKHWKKTKDITFHDGRPCEIGHCIYWPTKAKRLHRVIFIRALKEKEQNRSLFDDERWEYHAWVTTIGVHEMKNEAIIQLYRQRANAENFIRDLKHGFDLKHYPCKKLVANKAYGLIAALAYNLMRYAALLMNPMKPGFAKHVRFRLVRIACEVVKHARRTVLRIPHDKLKEITHWLEKMHTQFGYGTS